MDVARTCSSKTGAMKGCNFAQVPETTWFSVCVRPFKTNRRGLWDVARMCNPPKIYFGVRPNVVLFYIKKRNTGCGFARVCCSSSNLTINLRINFLRQRDWYCIAEQPAPAPHLAHPEGCAAPRIMLVTVPRVSRSCEQFLGKERQIQTKTGPGKRYNPPHPRLLEGLKFGV